MQDVQTAKVDWGDGSPAETVPVIAGDAGTVLVSATHPVPGVTVKLTVGRRRRRRGDRHRDARARAGQRGAGRRRRDGERAAAGETVDVDLPATDPEGDRLSYEIVDEPAHGRVSMRALDPLAPEQPEVTYVAADDVHGEDTFASSVTDGTGSSRTATVNVAVAPLPVEEGGPAAPSPRPSTPRRRRGRARRPRPRPRGRRAARRAATSRRRRAIPAARRARPSRRVQIVMLPSSKRCVSRRKFPHPRQADKSRSRAPTSRSRCP